MKKLSLGLGIICIILAIYIIQSKPYHHDYMDAKEYNDIRLNFLFDDAKLRKANGGPFEYNSSFDAKDGYGMKVRIENVEGIDQIRSAGPDKIFNTDDDVIKKDQP